MHNLPKGKWIVLDVLKSDSNLPKRDCIICFIESFFKIMKNGFYFILKAFSSLLLVI